MNEKLLLVDDEEGIRKVLGITLTDKGYHVLTAENGEEALRVFQKENPDIVITDIKMPVMDGIDVLRKIKQINPDAEVIIITGHGDMDLAIKSLRYEAADFITKPISIYNLEKAIQKTRERILIRQKLRDYTETLERLVHQKTEKLTAASRTQEGVQQYQYLFDEIPCYVAVIDKDFQINAGNRLFKRDFCETDGRRCFETLKKSKSPCAVCPVVQTFGDGASHQTEMLLTCRDGTQRNMIVWTSPLKDDNGDILRILVMFTNISQLLDLQDHLSSLGLMIGSVSHSIKGLLTNLDGGLYLLDSGVTRSDPVRISEGLQIIKLMVSRIKNMVLDILYYAKERELNIRKVKVVEFAEDTANLILQKMKSYSIDLYKDFDPRLDAFDIDPDQLQSALINILENAADACIDDKTKSDHQVIFSVRDDPEHVIFDVRDNGVGMTPETMKKLFTLFFSSKATKGTGMGLFVSNKIVRQHNGTISVTSEPGAGSMFTVKIPKIFKEKKSHCHP